MELPKKKARDRESNWESAETKFFRECVHRHLSVVESKLNDNTMVCKKRRAWDAIRAAMVAAGYDREIPKLKSKWVSMKTLAKKAVANMNQASDTTNSYMHAPEVSGDEKLMHKTIKEEFEEEEYTLVDVNYAESSISAEYSEQDFSNSGHKSLTNSKQYLVNGTRKNKRESSSSSSPQHFIDDNIYNKEDSYMSYKQKKQKKPRDREANWESAEIDYFRECFSMHLDVVESKANDTTMVCKKRKAWEAIRAAMLSAGYDREIPKLKSKYVSMKMMAKKAVAGMNQASNTADCSMHNPELNSQHNVLHKIIKEEFEDEEYNVHDANYEESSISAKYNEQDFPTNGYKFLNTPKQCTVNAMHKNKHDPLSHSSPKHQIIEDNTNNKEHILSSKLHHVPKTASKSSVILERQRQILTESFHSEEIHKLQKKQLLSEIEHKERMHKIKEIQEKELHALKLQHLQKQIDQDEELHALKLDILRKIAASNEKPNFNL